MLVAPYAYGAPYTCPFHQGFASLTPGYFLSAPSGLGSANFGIQVSSNIRCMNNLISAALWT